MATFQELYAKFGETAEAAQLMEHELGNMLLEIEAEQKNLFTEIDVNRAKELIDNINSHTLGRLLKHLGQQTDLIDPLQAQLQFALAERNRLTHTFFRQHNLRRNSDGGRAKMLEDLEMLHATLLNAVVALMKLRGIDLEAISEELGDALLELPSTHLPI